MYMYIVQELDVELTLNIPLRLTSEGEGSANMAKCLIILGVTGLRPPPGGAHAAHIVTSFMSFQNSFSLS